MDIWALIAAFVVGLVLGSFLSVVISRVPRREPLLVSRSRCPECGTELGLLDLIPLVSWLVLRGHCRYCGERISVRYPLIELSTGALCVLSVLLFDLSIEALLVAVLLCGLLALSLIDIETKTLPNPIVFTLYVIGLMGIATATILGLSDVLPWWWGIVRALICSAAALVGYFLIGEIGYLLTGREGMGFGDAKLAAVIGLFLGFLGVDYVIVANFAAFVLGAVGSLFMIMIGRRTRRDKIPFGAYLSLGALVSLLVAQPVLAWYWRIGLG